MKNSYSADSENVLRSVLFPNDL